MNIDSEIEINEQDARIISNILVESSQLVNTAKQKIDNSYQQVPSQIKGSIASNYLSIMDNLQKVFNNCLYASTGIIENVQAYLKIEKQNSFGTETLIKGENLEKHPFYWGYTSNNDGSLLKRANSEFFQQMADSNRGILENGIYTVIDSDGAKYSYNIFNGKLEKYMDNKLISSSICGLYYPMATGNYNNLNASTILFGDGEHPTSSSYSMEQYDLVQTVINDKCNSLIVIPQCRSGKDSGLSINNGYAYNDNVKMAVVSSTQFANAVIGDNPNRKNTIVGFSSGGFSSLDIAATTGNDTYDRVVVINSYLKTEGVRGGGDTLTPLSVVSNLKDKEIIFLEAKYDGGIESNGSGRNNNFNKKSLEIMKQNNIQDITFVTSDNSVVKKVDFLGYKASYVNDNRWEQHGSMGYIYASSNIGNYSSEN